MEKILFTTNSQKILEFLIQTPGEELSFQGNSNCR